MNPDALESVQQLVAEYSQAHDDGRANDLANLFAVDATFTVSGTTYQGRDAIRDAIGRRAGDALPVQHVTTNCFAYIDPLGVTARGRTDFHFLTRVGDDIVISSAGRYYDRLVRETERWRFTSRTVVFLGEDAPADW